MSNCKFKTGLGCSFNTIRNNEYNTGDFCTIIWYDKDENNLTVTKMEGIQRF